MNVNSVIFMGPLKFLWVMDSFDNLISSLKKKSTQNFAVIFKS